MEEGVTMRKLELYIHIPFCVRKCAYCDFLSAPAGRDTQKQYVNALKREIEEFPCKKEYKISSVFFGGGTPSVLPGEEIAQIMTLLKKKFVFSEDAEISLECNPGTADEQKLGVYRDCGINRLSFGLQSADNTELELLGRIHTWEAFLTTYEAARRVGFTNINVDLMSALPGQTADSWKETLRKVIALDPEHIYAYSLIIEEGTPFYEKYEEDARKREAGEQPEFLPSEEEEREMYQLTEELLDEAGMHRYEISNYAKSGCECRHNIGYWDGTEYVGFGLGASSMLRVPESEPVGWPISKVQKKETFDQTTAMDCASENVEEQKNCMTLKTGQENMKWEKAVPADQRCVDQEETQQKKPQYSRFRNTADLQSYISGDFSGREEEILTEQDRMEEFMFLGLRMMYGVSEEVFEKRFGRKIDEVYGAVLEKQQKLGLLSRKAGRICLTKRGIDVSNGVMAEFLLE